MVRQEAAELVGGQGGASVGEGGEGLGDVGRGAGFGDGELPVETAECFVGVSVSGHGDGWRWRRSTILVIVAVNGTDHRERERERVLRDGRGSTFERQKEEKPLMEGV